ncbi:hypothetical protein AURDEDRAFT_152128 [Auricularia subglabra TFB-10046 SS5]|nr:hypothetical protein AURDEDRAFT_152128 [Auricularia subglabra TFB-10046 SS5]
MVTFSKVLNTFRLVRRKSRAPGPATSGGGLVTSAPCSTMSAAPVLRQADEFSVLVSEGADYDSVKITAPDGAWERRWPRQAPSQPPQQLGHPAPAVEPSASTASPAQRRVWDDAARAASAAVVFAASAVLLADSIPPGVRKHFQRGLQLLQDAIDADDAVVSGPVLARPSASETSSSEESATSYETLQIRPRASAAAAAPVPFTSAAEDRFSRPSIDRWLLDYWLGGGIHNDLAYIGDLIVDLARADESVLYRAYGTLFHVSVEFSNLDRFERSAVHPPVRTLVILSRQFPWPVEVHAQPEEPFVRIVDVLRMLRHMAHVTMRETEYQLALHAENGRRRMSRAHGRRARGIAPEHRGREPFCLVDFLGENTILGGLRKDVDNAMLKELIPQPWRTGTEETLHLVANFVSRAHVHDVLKAWS